MKKYVLFDLDGTLLDTTEGIIESVLYTIHAMKLEELSYDELLSFIGPPIKDSFFKKYNMTENEADKATSIFRNYYKDNALFKARPYCEIFELLELMKKAGITLGVATYKREDYAIRLLRQFKFDRYMASMHGADNDNVFRKSDIIKMCLDEMLATPELSVYVGDTAHDLIGAREAGIAFVGVTYGFGFENDDQNNENCIGYASTPMEVWDKLK